MVKKKKKKKVKVDKEFNNKINRLETDLKYTLRAIENNGTDVDQLFVNQASKIRQQIKNLKDSNGLS